MVTKIVLVAPFWNQPENVALRRLQAMRRWLRSAGAEVVVLSAGEDERERPLAGGTEIQITDPKGAFGSLRAEGGSWPGAGVFRLLGSLKDNPDAGVAWAHAVARSPLAREAAAGAGLVISSSPPESAHVAGAAVAQVCGGVHVVDMQDGWLDEPLKPVLQKIPWRRWQEGRLERRILQEAGHILVTSEVWARRLRSRLRFTSPKITTLFSAYPPTELQAEGRPDPVETSGFSFLHAGTFTFSHNARRIEHLLGPMLAGLSTAGAQGRIQLLGRLQSFELDAVAQQAADFSTAGWSLVAAAPIPRETYLQLLPRQHGLLLLSASMGALPSKLFEYLTTGRPILAVTRESSAVWELHDDLPALHCVDYRRPDSWETAVRSFLDASRRREPFPVPSQFTEDALGRVFLDALEPLLAP